MVHDRIDSDSEMKDKTMAKILVIEDDDSFRNVLVQMLSRAGFEVRQAGDGNQAIEVCAQFEPDLVLTDIIMPDKEDWKPFRSYCRYVLI
jgi:CheY-like chemotaxis protein